MAGSFTFEMVFLSKDFQQSTIDPSLFFNADCILLVYTNDCLILSPSTQQIQFVIESLQQTFLTKDEREVKDFLGICISQDLQNGTITIIQPGLINSVLQNLGLLSTKSEKV